MEFTIPMAFFFGAVQYISDYTNYTATSILWNPIGRWSGVYADTTGGRVSGTRQVSRLGKVFYQFKGIPYAEPPTSALRYEPPVKHGGWEGTLDGTSFRSQCPQVNLVTRRIVGSEDCLFLNIATRKAYTKETLMTLNDEDLHPVIVFIHGGLFMFGQANPFGSKYFLDEEVVLVTINYRLNSFGFLNTGDGVVPGNMGLKDQSMALQWVQENIRYFNGDAKRVTLLGESAGSASVHLQTLSPMSRGLFAGAISIGGTALSPWAHVHEPGIQAIEFGEELGCPKGEGEEGSRQMIACLKALPMHRVASYHIGYIHKGTSGKQTVFGPTVDSISSIKNSSTPLFLPDNPVTLLRKGEVSEAPWITGVNSADGLAYLIPILRNDSLRKTLNSRWDELAPALLSYQSSIHRSVLNSGVKKYYLNDTEVSSSCANESASMLSDRGFFLDNHDAALLQARTAPTYAFYYTYRGVFAMANLLFYKTPLPLPNDFNYMVGTGIQWMVTMMLNRKQKKQTFGVGHGDEMPLLFNIPLIRREVSKNDVDFQVSRNMVKLFVSFAKQGVPHIPTGSETGSSENVSWDPVQVSNPQLRDVPLQRLQIDQKFVMIDEPFYDGIQFWKKHAISHLELET